MLSLQRYLPNCQADSAALSINGLNTSSLAIVCQAHLAPVLFLAYTHSLSLHLGQLLALPEDIPAQYKSRTNIYSSHCT